ncbi:hypothetical protein ABKN59_008743 [Abortiporus biennis]
MLQCKSCNQAFSKKKELVHHINTTHTRRCPACDVLFFNENDMIQHQILAHGQIANPEDNLYAAGHTEARDATLFEPTCDRAKVQGQPPYSCPESECVLLKFQTQSELNSHIYDVHCVYCQLCSTLFDFLPEYLAHLVHCPRICDHCKDILPNQDMLDEHVAIKHLDKSLVLACPCGGDYHYEKSQEHWDTSCSPLHPKCKVCRSGFADKTALEEHVAKKHCPLCEGFFADEKSRETHQCSVDDEYYCSDIESETDDGSEH